jgi:endonuclease G, mitochondrial
MKLVGSGSIVCLALYFFAVGVLEAGCSRYSRPGTAPDPEKKAVTSPTPVIPDLPYGNPSDAGIEDPDNYLVVHDSYVLSYNNNRGTLNWVAWRTDRKDLGDAIERSLFEPDPQLPASFKHVQYYDYSGSGFDRGHMVPSADRFGDKSLNIQTFLMTNVVPQAGDLNQYPWQKLESYARSLVYRGNSVYTLAGVYGEIRRIRGKVTVPSNCWKIIAVLPKGQGLGRSTRIVAVDMPNRNGVRNDGWEKYKTSVRSIESKTGYNFFSSLPQELQDKLETQIDGQ